MTRDAGERRSIETEDVGALPLFRGAARPTLEALRAHTDHLVVGDGTLVLPAGRAVDWLPFAVDGPLREAGPHGRRWPAGRPAGLGEALTRRLLDRAVVADGATTLLYVEVRALTAAITVDPVLGLAVARTLAGGPAPGDEPAARPARRRHPRRRVVPA